MASNFAFTPMGVTSNVTATVVSSTVTLTFTGPSITTGQLPPNGARFANLGTVAIYVQFGVTAPTVALSTGMPILSNTVETLQFKGQNAMAFTSVGTTTMFITLGEGL